MLLRSNDYYDHIDDDEDGVDLRSNDGQEIIRAFAGGTLDPVPVTARPGSASHGLQTRMSGLRFRRPASPRRPRWWWPFSAAGAGLRPVCGFGGAIPKPRGCRAPYRALIPTRKETTTTTNSMMTTHQQLDSCTMRSRYMVPMRSLAWPDFSSIYGTIMAAFKGVIGVEVIEWDAVR